MGQHEGRAMEYFLDSALAYDPSENRPTLGSIPWKINVQAISLVQASRPFPPKDESLPLG